MSKQLRFGFVGAGEIAVASARALRGAQHAALTRVVDARADLAHDLAAMYGGQPAESTEALLADVAVEAVYICVPHFLHKDLAVQAAEARKHGRTKDKEQIGFVSDDASGHSWSRSTDVNRPTRHAAKVRASG